MDDSEQTQRMFLNRVTKELDKRESELSAETLRDLRLARYKALEGLHKPRPFWQPVILAASLATLVALVVVSLQVMQPRQTVMTPPSMEDMALLGSKDKLDLYENLEFYQWLAQEQHNS